MPEEEVDELRIALQAQKEISANLFIALNDLAQVTLTLSKMETARLNGTMTLAIMKENKLKIANSVERMMKALHDAQNQIWSDDGSPK